MFCVLTHFLRDYEHIKFVVSHITATDISPANPSQIRAGDVLRCCVDVKCTLWLCEGRGGLTLSLTDGCPTVRFSKFGKQCGCPVARVRLSDLRTQIINLIGIVSLSYNSNSYKPCIL